MIDTLDPHKCTGCFACVQKCPKHCIAIIKDHEGFLAPKINAEVCIQCGLCEKACPQLTPQQLHEPRAAYAAKIRDDALLAKSTSGGVFALAARTILRGGGVVFGVAMDENGIVKTVFIEDEGELPRLQSSKYVQACVGNSYIQAKQFLDVGREVLFSGTPCQIAGLYGYLGKTYERLYTIDIICHGVPSQELHSAYRKYLERKRKQRLISWRFRDKSSDEGWAQIDRLVFEKKIVYQREMLDPYTRAFLEGVDYRESCYQCLYAKENRIGDLTLGDYWGIQTVHPEFFSMKGVSCVLATTEKGCRLINRMDDNIELLPSKLELIKQRNGNLVRPSRRCPERDSFYADFKMMRMEQFVRRHMRVPFDAKEYVYEIVPRSIRQKAKRILRQFLRK